MPADRRPATSRNSATTSAEWSRRAELVALGVDDRSLRRAVATGEVDPHSRRACTRAPTCPRRSASPCGTGACSRCVSVARRRGLWVLPLDDLVHVSMPPNGHSHASRLVHVRAALERAVPHSRLRCRWSMRCCRSEAAIGADAFFATLESALPPATLDGSGSRGLCSRGSPSRRAGSWTSLGSDAESGLESLLRLRLHRIGLTLRTQVEIPGVGASTSSSGIGSSSRSTAGRTTTSPRSDTRTSCAMPSPLRTASHTLRFDYALVVHDWPLVEAADPRERSSAGSTSASRVAGRRR